MLKGNYAVHGHFGRESDGVLLLAREHSPEKGELRCAWHFRPRIGWSSPFGKGTFPPRKGNCAVHGHFACESDGVPLLAREHSLRERGTTLSWAHSPDTLHVPGKTGAKTDGLATSRSAATGVVGSVDALGVMMTPAADHCIPASQRHVFERVGISAYRRTLRQNLKISRSDLRQTGWVEAAIVR